MFELLVIGSIVITVIIYFLIRRERNKTLRRDLSLHKKDIVTAENEFKDNNNEDLYLRLTRIKRKTCAILGVRS